MTISTSQMLIIFGFLALVYLLRFVKWFIKLGMYAENPKLRRKAIDVTMKSSMQFAVSFSVVLIVLIFG